MEVRSPDRWDAGCEGDSIRNDFVVPFLAKVIRNAQADVVGDIGCGTGYITREVARHLHPSRVDWHLLDHDDGMLTYARSHCADLEGAHFHRFDLCVENRATQLPDFALGFVAYAFLDIEVNKQVASNTAKLIRPEGLLLLFTPDVLEDVIQMSGQRPELLDEYRRGVCSFKKLDKFTQTDVTFRANRMEALLEFFVSAGFQLLHVEKHQATGDKRHYAFVLKKTTNALSLLS